MKIKKFLKKYPEFAEYKVYYIYPTMLVDGKPYVGSYISLGLEDLCYPCEVGDYTTLRVLYVDEHKKHVVVSYSNM